MRKSHPLPKQIENRKQSHLHTNSLSLEQRVAQGEHVKSVGGDLQPANSAVIGGYYVPDGILRRQGGNDK